MHAQWKPQAAQIAVAFFAKPPAEHGLKAHRNCRLQRYHLAMKQLSFDDLHVFSRVAELGSLSACARERDVPVSQISRTLSRIEKQCAARLLHRSTHGLSLTAEGRTLLGYCQRMAHTLDELEGEFVSKTRQASGLVRVAASTVMAQQLLVPSLAKLGVQFPKVRVDLLVSDVPSDMAREGIDIAIRTASELPETVVARRLGLMRRGLYAAPGYLASVGVPLHPDELHQHRLIANSAVALMNHWPVSLKGKKTTFTAEGQWRSNDTNVVASMVLQGLGIGLLSSLTAAPLVKQNLLVAVLPDCVGSEPVAIYAVTAGQRRRLPKIKVCLDHWAAWFARAEALESPKI
jgi:DNA-binding transcriptional LysR family regulator